MQKITTSLWFNDNAEEAINFYTSIFPNSKIKQVSRYDEAGARVAGKTMGSVMTMSFTLDGQEFVAINGGPSFQFTPAISFVIACKDQEEVDEYWDALTEEGKEGQCGWLQDKYGLSWQIVPVAMNALMTDSDPEKSKRVTEAMLKMKKLDIGALQNAYDNVKE